MMPQLDRITLDANVMGGKPCIRGMRVTVGTIVGLIASGATAAEILDDYPYLEADGIPAALSYAAWRAEEIDVPLPRPRKLLIDMNLPPTSSPMSLAECWTASTGRTWERAFDTRARGAVRPAGEFYSSSSFGPPGPSGPRWGAPELSCSARRRPMSSANFVNSPRSSLPSPSASNCSACSTKRCEL